ncbi:MAG: hypothetical protein QM760_18120 [Nibricoccus sp.]
MSFFSTSIRAIPFFALTLPSFGQSNAIPVESSAAVSALNGKLGVSYGDMDGGDGHNLAGSLTFPVAHNWGAQVDGLYTQVEKVDFGGGAAHVFWRNPDRALIGLTASAITSDFVQSQDFGVEAEYYWKIVTFGVHSGVGFIKYDTSAPFIETDRSDGFVTASATVYPVENLSVRAHASVRFEQNSYGAEVEFQIPKRNLAITADLVRGDSGYDHALFGLRYYFGGKKTLRNRHRHDDPRNLAGDTLYAVGNYGAQYNAKAREYLQALTAANPGLAASSPDFSDYGYSDYIVGFQFGTGSVTRLQPW